MPSKMAHRTIMRYWTTISCFHRESALELRCLNRRSLRWFAHTILSICLLELSLLIRQNKRNLIKKNKICLLRIYIQWRAAGTILYRHYHFWLLSSLLLLLLAVRSFLLCQNYIWLNHLTNIVSYVCCFFSCVFSLVPHVFRSLEMEMPTYGSS